MSSANAGCEPAKTGCSGESTPRGPCNLLAGLRLWALSTALAGLITSGCGTHATLDVTAPSNAVAGSPFTVTVTALVGGRRDTVINSPIHFTSSDTAAVLPPDYYFNANDAGSHTFPNGVTLKTPGSQSISVTVFDASGINGTANISVSEAGTVN